MKWTWENFGIYMEPDRPEPEKLDPATVHAAPFDPAAIESTELDSGTSEVTTLESEASEWKTIPCLSPMPAGAQRVRRIILDCLHLRDRAQTEIQFYETAGKSAVIVQAKDVNPTWQEIQDASRQSGWDVEVFAAAKFERLKRSAIQDFERIQAIPPGLARSLVNHGYFSLQELAAMDVKTLMRLSGLDQSQAHRIIQQAEFDAEQLEF